MNDLDSLRRRIIKARLSRVASELIEMAAACVIMETSPCTEDAIPVGASKFGGSPDLPPQFDWPRWKDSPLAFLGQIHLSALTRTGHLGAPNSLSIRLS